MIAHRTGLAYDVERIVPPESEAHFQAKVIEVARLLGWHRVYHPWMSVHSASGWPDLVLCKPPRLVFAELKKAKGRVSPSQQGWIDDLLACGQEAYVWRPSDWATVVSILQGRQP